MPPLPLPLALQDPVPLSKFDAWYTPTCRIPGVKADLSGAQEGKRSLQSLNCGRRS